MQPPLMITGREAFLLRSPPERARAPNRFVLPRRSRDLISRRFGLHSELSRIARHRARRPIRSRLADSTRSRQRTRPLTTPLLCRRPDRCHCTRPDLGSTPNSVTPRSAIRVEMRPGRRHFAPACSYMPLRNWALSPAPRRGVQRAAWPNVALRRFSRRIRRRNGAARRCAVDRAAPSVGCAAGVPLACSAEPRRAHQALAGASCRDRARRSW